MESTDQLLIEFEEQERWRDLLGEVLAVLNGDGGHYQTKHGAGLAAIEGIRSHYQMVADIDTLRAENARLRDQADALAGHLEEVMRYLVTVMPNGAYRCRCCGQEGDADYRRAISHHMAGWCHYWNAALAAYRECPGCSFQRQTGGNHDDVPTGDADPNCAYREKSNA